jgi:hypothetical protein
VDLLIVMERCEGDEKEHASILRSIQCGVFFFLSLHLPDNCLENPLSNSLAKKTILLEKILFATPVCLPSVSYFWKVVLSLPKQMVKLHMEVRNTASLLATLLFSHQ